MTSLAVGQGGVDRVEPRDGVVRRGPGRHDAGGPVERFAPADDERQFGQRAGRHGGESGRVLAVDQAPYRGPLVGGERRERRRERPHVAQVELKLLRPGRAHEREREAQHLDVGGDTAFAQQLAAHLEDLASSTLPLGILAEHLAGVREAQRRGPVGELGRGEARHAGGEVVAQRQQLAVQVEETDQPVGDVRRPAAGAHEDLGVLERGRDDFLEARRLEALEHAALEGAAAPHGVTGEIERAGRNRGDGGTSCHGVVPSPATCCSRRAAPTRRPSISTISNAAPRTLTRSPTLGSRPSVPKR